VHQPPTVSNNNNIESKQHLVIITFIITGHRMVAVNPHINNNDGIIIGLFLFLSPPKTNIIFGSDRRHFFRVVGVGLFLLL